MAVTGTFLADFSNFNTGVDQASSKLLKFETSSERAAASLNKMGGGTASSALRGLGSALGQVDQSLAAVGVRVGPAERAINEMAKVADKTASELGAVATAGAVLGAGIAGWQIGRAISDFLGLDKVIGDATAKLLGFGDVAGQQAGAAADTLARASRIAGRQVTDLTEAIRINEAAAKKTIAANQELATVSARLHAPEEFVRQMANWRGEIDKVTSAGLLPTLNQLITENRFSEAELAKQFGISEAALRDYTQRFKEHKSDLEAATAANKKFDESLSELDVLLDAAKRDKKAQADQEHDGAVKAAEGIHQKNIAEADAVIASQKAAAADKQRAQSLDDVAAAANHAMGSVADYSSIPGAELLGGQTVESFLHLLEGTPLAPGENPVNRAVAAFKAAALQARQDQASGITVHVSGVWDKRSQHELTQTVQQGVTKARNTVRPRGWG